jgi:hypothetical protein
MAALALILPPFVIFAVFQLVKRLFPAADAAAPFVKQAIVVAGSIAGSVLYTKLGLPIPQEIHDLQSAALVGLIQGFAALGVHGVKAAVS